MGCRGRLAQSGERPLSNPAIRGRTYEEEVFFRVKRFHHKTYSIKCATSISSKINPEVSKVNGMKRILTLSLSEKGMDPENWPYDVTYLESGCMTS